MDPPLVSSTLPVQVVAYEDEDPCLYIEPSYLKERFILVAIVGTAVSLINICENVFLVLIFFSKASFRSSHNLYLGLLALFDILIAAAYIPLMSANLVVDYYKSVIIMRAWFHYMIPMITISHIAMTASSFLMVAASFERYCVTARPQWTAFLSEHRIKIAVGSIILGFLSKFSQALELEIRYVDECAGTMSEWTLDLSDLATNATYNSLWRIWFRSVFTILLPFFLLATMNAKIVLVTQKNDRFQFIAAQKLSDAKRKSRVRAATRTLLFVVFTYLLSNVLNVIVTIWEYIDYHSLTVDFNAFYTFAVDVVSLLTVFAGALRLPIYVMCQSQLRREFSQALKAVCWGKDYKAFGKKSVRADSLPAADTGGMNQYGNMLLGLGKAFIHEVHREEEEQREQGKERREEKDTVQRYSAAATDDDNVVQFV